MSMPCRSDSQPANDFVLNVSDDKLWHRPKMLSMTAFLKGNGWRRNPYAKTPPSIRRRGLKSYERNQINRREELVDRSVVNIDPAALAIEAHAPLDKSENRVILADSHTLTCEELGSTLTDDDIAGNHMLTAEFLD
jgi:hypothetical protein